MTSTIIAQAGSSRHWFKLVQRPLVFELQGLGGAVERITPGHLFLAVRSLNEGPEARDMAWALSSGSGSPTLIDQGFLSRLGYVGPIRTGKRT